MNKRLFVIIRSEQLEGVAFQRLRDACDMIGVTCFPIATDKPFPKIHPEPNPEDAFLVRARQEVARSYCEKFMVYGCKNMYLPSYTSHFGSYPFAKTMATVNVPTIPQVQGAKIEREDLLAISNQLQGFPLVIKVTGSQTGRNVMRVDSWESFLSVSSFLYYNIEPHRVIYQKYIPHERQARLVVVGDKVVASMEFQKANEDFRLNTGVHKKIPGAYSSELCELAVKATHAGGTKFAGVDILFDTNGDIYIAEVNNPCAFARTQDITGIDINAAILRELF